MKELKLISNQNCITVDFGSLFFISGYLWLIFLRESWSHTHYAFQSEAIILPDGDNQRSSKDQLLKPPTSSHYQQTFYISLKLLSCNAEQYSFFKNHFRYPKLSVFNVFKICIYNFMEMINQNQFLCWKCGHISWNNNHYKKANDIFRESYEFPKAFFTLFRFHRVLI